MKKLRPLPIFTIRDTDFVVDIDRFELREAERPSNRISFVGMRDMSDHYQFYYDVVEKTDNPAILDPITFVEVTVPPLVELDPVGMAEKYGIPVEQLAGKTDYEVMVDHEALGRRLKGELPRIDIAGEIFIVDLQTRELRHAVNFHPVLNLKNFEQVEGGLAYEAYYHPLIRQVVPIDAGMTEFPEHIIRIRLPFSIALDPVGFAKKHNLDERDFVKWYPPLQTAKAIVIPLSETEIPALIQRNREQLRKEHKENSQRVRPRHRPRF